MKYILLLRGVNVGGNRKVRMPELRGMLTTAGFSQVSSYINSGNLIFASDEPIEQIKNTIEDLLASQYAFPIDFIILDARTWHTMIAAVPTWWGQKQDWRHNALFKLPGYQSEYDQLILEQMTTEYDHVHITDTVIFWSSPAKANYSRSLYAKLLKTLLYQHVSIRNQNTTLKLTQLLA